MGEWKVYKWDDIDWLATQWDLGRTIEWYRNNVADMDDDDIKEIEESDLDTVCMWVDVSDDVNREEIGEIEHISEIKKPPQHGDYCLHDGDVCQYVTFREAISIQAPEIGEPFIIASTDW